MSTEKIEVKQGDHVVILNPSITYQQDKDITSVYLEKDLDPSQAMKKADKLGIEAVVFSVDGKTEKVYEEFVKLPLAVAKAFVIEIKKILDPKVEAPESAKTV